MRKKERVLLPKTSRDPELRHVDSKVQEETCLPSGMHCNWLGSDQSRRHSWETKTRRKTLWYFHIFCLQTHLRQSLKDRMDDEAKQVYQYHDDNTTVKKTRGTNWERNSYKETTTELFSKQEKKSSWEATKKTITSDFYASVFVITSVWLFITYSDFHGILNFAQISTFEAWTLESSFSELRRWRWKRYPQPGWGYKLLGLQWPDPRRRLPSCHQWSLREEGLWLLLLVQSLWQQQQDEGKDQHHCQQHYTINNNFVNTKCIPLDNEMFLCTTILEG